MTKYLIWGPILAQLAQIWAQMFLADFTSTSS